MTWAASSGFSQFVCGVNVIDKWGSNRYIKGAFGMKKILFALILVLLLAAAAVVYWYAPARDMAMDMYQQAKMHPMAQKLSGNDKAQPAPAEPAPAPEVVAQEPAPAPDAVEPAPETAPEPVAEPAPAPLPALNAEAETLLPKAEAGDAVAQFNLARQYVLGEGMAVNREEFVRWCGTAADQGLPEAQFTMGCCYRDGLWVEKNEEKGMQLLRQAAENGFAPAAAALAQ